MPRRVKQKSSILAPAGSLIKRLSETDIRVRRRVIRYAMWAIGLFFVYSTMSGTYGIPRIVRLKLQKEALIEANRQRAAELVDASRECDMLRFDPVYIEQIARTRYHMVRSNETIYRYRGQ